MAAYINNTIHDMYKKFAFRKRFRDTVLLGGFRGAFATCALAFAKECQITACAFFITEVFEAAHLLRMSGAKQMFT